MNQKIKNHLIAFNQKEGYGITDKDLLETITETKPIFTQIIGKHRWYEDEFRVVEIDGMLIGYDGFHTTGDTSWRDMDLEYDIDSVCEVEKKQKTIDYYDKVA